MARRARVLRRLSLRTRSRSTFAAAAMRTNYHVVNCLGGPRDTNFDAAAGNPCKDQGNGAIPDTTDAGKKASLQQAMQQALAGLKETDMAAAQKDATAAQGVLKPSM